MINAGILDEDYVVVDKKYGLKFSDSSCTYKW